MNLNYICGCCRSIDRHNGDVIEQFKLNNEHVNLCKWNPQTCTTQSSEFTDCYGEIRFNNNPQLISKVVKLSIELSKSMIYIF